MEERLDLAELEALYASLHREERDELLQSLLIAASLGEETVTQRLEERLMLHAGQRFIDDVSAGKMEGTHGGT
jgi:hypothetical protein